MPVKKNESFLSPQEHFDILASNLPADKLALFDGTTHGRIEVAYRNRSFFVYEMVNGSPVIHHELVVQDYLCNNDEGASTELLCRQTGRLLVVAYEPTQVFDYQIFVSIPVHHYVKWSTTPSRPRGGSLAFPLLIRTLSRTSLRDHGVMFMETGNNYVNEFGPINTAA
jgi:hypothetical protein